MKTFRNLPWCEATDKKCSDQEVDGLDDAHGKAPEDERIRRFSPEAAECQTPQLLDRKRERGY